MTYQHIQTDSSTLFVREDFSEFQIRGGLKTEVVFGYNRFTGEPTALHFVWTLEIYNDTELVMSLKIEDAFRLNQPETATKAQLVIIARESLQRFRELSAKEFAERKIDFAFPEYHVEKGIYNKMLAELKKHRQ